MQTIAEILAGSKRRAAVEFAGASHEVYPFSAADARWVKCWFKLPKPPRIPHPDKSADSKEWVDDTKDSVYLANVDEAVMKRWAAQIAISLRLKAEDGSEFVPGHGDKNKRWAEAVVGSILNELGEAEIGALVALVEKANASRLTPEEAVKN